MRYAQCPRPRAYLCPCILSHVHIQRERDIYILYITCICKHTHTSMHIWGYRVLHINLSPHLDFLCRDIRCLKLLVEHQLRFFFAVDGVAAKVLRVRRPNPSSRDHLPIDTAIHMQNNNTIPTAYMHTICSMQLRQTRAPVCHRAQILLRHPGPFFGLLVRSLVALADAHFKRFEIAMGFQEVPQFLSLHSMPMYP